VAEKVIYYAGCFANYYDPEVGKALIKILRRSGIEVILPEQKCCGMPMLANGNLKGARENIEYNLKSLTRAASPDHDILTTCPSCNLMLRKECLAFFESEEARFVSSHVYDAGEYLLRLHRQGRLNLDLREMPLRVFYHNPCHLKVQNLTREPVELLKLIPALVVSGVNTSCCGMGGSYGMKKANYDLSVAIAEKVWREVKAASADLVVTECGGCKLQIESGTGAKVVHPLVLLDQACQS